MVGVSFRAGKVSVGEDTEAPFEAAIPEQALRDELPDSAKVIAQALFRTAGDSRSRLTLRACGR